MAGVVEDTQDCVLQSLLSLPDPGQFPPFRSVLVLLRDLVLVPFPHVFEQDDHVDQGPQTQSSGKNDNNSKLNNCNLKWLNQTKNL